MTIYEAKQFYKKDSKEYILNNNKQFLKWYKDKIKESPDTSIIDERICRWIKSVWTYFPEKCSNCFYLSLEGMQQLIDFLVGWYEIKYSEKLLKTGVIYPEYENFNPISKELDMQQLFYRLSHEETMTLKARQRVQSVIMWDDDQTLSCLSTIMQIDEKGMISANELKFFKQQIGTKEKEMFFEDFCNLMEQSNSGYNLKEIRKFIYFYKSDLELRNILLNLVLKALVYSTKTTPENGQKRAHYFAKEFNQHFGNEINLSCDEIDKLIKEAYADNLDKQLKMSYNSNKSSRFSK